MRRYASSAWGCRIRRILPFFVEEGVTHEKRSKFSGSRPLCEADTTCIQGRFRPPAAPAQVAHWYNFIGCNFPYLVDTSLGVRPFGQTYDKRSISIETLQNILNLVPPRRTSKIKKIKRKEKKNCFVVPAVPVVPRAASTY